MQQRRHRIDPVKDCASQQLQRPISGKATTRLRQSLVRRARLKLGFRASCALLERTSSKWTYRQLLGALPSSLDGPGRRETALAGILSGTLFSRATLAKNL